MSHFSRLWISREKREKEWNSSREMRKKPRKILPYKMGENPTWNLGLILFRTRKMMSKAFSIFYMLYRSGLCLKEFGTLKNHTKSAKIMSKMKKLISHFSYLNFLWEISRIVIPRFLVSHEELRRVVLTD